MEKSKLQCLLCNDLYPCSNLGCKFINNFNDYLHTLSKVNDIDMVNETEEINNYFIEKIKELKLKYIID